MKRLVLILAFALGSPASAAGQIVCHSIYYKYGSGSGQQVPGPDLVADLASDGTAFNRVEDQKNRTVYSVSLNRQGMGSIGFTTDDVTQAVQVMGDLAKGLTLTMANRLAAGKIGMQIQCMIQ